MKRGIRPIAHPRHKAVLEWIDVTIFDVTGIVCLVPDQMLPEPSLPDAALVACNSNGTKPLLLWQRFREATLDQPPSRGEIVITRRQIPHCVQMIGQHDECIDRESMTLTRQSDRLT